ncbi:MAG: hypothetical protein ACOX3I_06915 [Limnochordia bacterium]|jgi:hypothetical protein
MKRAMFFVLVAVMVVGLSAQAMANLGGKSMDVELTILPHAYFEGPDTIKLDDLDFSQEYRAKKDVTLRFYANTDLGIGIRSRGFQDAEEQRAGLLNGWQNWTSYTLYEGGTPVSTFGGGHSENGMLDYKGDVAEITLRVDVKASEDDWYKVKSGTYSDVFTITIWAK